MKTGRKYPLLAGLVCLGLALGCRASPAGGVTPTAVRPTASRVSPGTALPPVTLAPSPAPATASPSPQVAPSQAPAAGTQSTTRGAIARRHLEAFSRIGARPSGSKEEQQAARYIQAALQKMGYETQVQPFTFHIDDDQDEVFHSANVIALKEGRSSREIVVGAHYDSGDEGDGVDDNASGVAALLETAERVYAVDTPYTIRFVAFGAEEEGLHGSYHYVDQLSPAEIKNTVAMINLDSLAAGDYAYVYGEDRSGSLRDWIVRMAPATGFPLDTRPIQDLDDPDGTPCECSDYSPFQEAGISIAYFEATNWNAGDQDGWTQVDPRYGDEGSIWHTEYDTLAYLEQTFPGRIDQHLQQFSALLYNTLTQYQAAR